MAKRRAPVRDGDGDGEDGATTGGLDDDTLLQILDRIPTRELLTRAALVCRRWSRLCRSSHVREIVPPFRDFSGWEMDSPAWIKPEDVLKLACKHASTITSITFLRSSDLSQEIVTAVSNIPNLRHLSASILDPTCLCEVLPPHLQSLEIFCLYYDESSFLRALPSRCPVLHTLKLLGVGVTLPYGDFGVVIKGLSSSLTTLHLSSHDLTWEHINDIFMYCSNLSDLCVEASRHLYASASSIIPMPPYLTSLSLCVSHGVSVSYDHATPWKLIKDSGRQLQALYAKSTSSATWQAIYKECSNLKVLDLSSVREFVQTEHQETKLCEIPSALPKLEKVCLPFASDRVLVQFGRFCSQLIELEFDNGLYRVKDKGILALVEGCSKLQVLSLASCNEITRSSMRFIAFHCPCLRALSLYDCKFIDDEAVAMLFPRLSTSLQCLNLDYCPRISAATLEFLREQAPKLELLVIQRTLHKKLDAFIKSIKLDRPLLKIKAGRKGVSLKFCL